MISDQKLVTCVVGECASVDITFRARVAFFDPEVLLFYFQVARQTEELITSKAKLFARLK